MPNATGSPWASAQLCISAVKAAECYFRYDLELGPIKITRSFAVCLVSTVLVVVIVAPITAMGNAIKRQKKLLELPSWFALRLSKRAPPLALVGGGGKGSSASCEFNYTSNATSIAHPNRRLGFVVANEPNIISLAPSYTFAIGLNWKTCRCLDCAISLGYFHSPIPGGFPGARSAESFGMGRLRCPALLHK
jgi:hypothetical protein